MCMYMSSKCTTTQHSLSDSFRQPNLSYLQEVRIQMYSVFNVPIGSSRRTPRTDGRTDGRTDNGDLTKTGCREAGDGPGEWSLAAPRGGRGTLAVSSSSRLQQKNVAKQTRSPPNVRRPTSRLPRTHLSQTQSTCSKKIKNMDFTITHCDQQLAGRLHAALRDKGYSTSETELGKL